MPTEKSDLEFKDCELELKVASGDGPGTLEGYAAVFGNVDRDNEVIVPGAFTKSIEDFKSSGFLCNGHNWKEELGTILDAKEDDRACLSSLNSFDPDAQRVPQSAWPKSRHAGPPAVSIGYRVKSAEKRNGVRYLQEIDVHRKRSASTLSRQIHRRGQRH
jgi:HK97 family phage prohead protease